MQERQSKEAQTRGIDINDLEQMRAAAAGNEDAKNPLHAANMVPRFGSDLGFSSKGIQVWFGVEKTACDHKAPVADK